MQYRLLPANLPLFGITVKVLDFNQSIYVQYHPKVVLDTWKTFKACLAEQYVLKANIWIHAGHRLIFFNT